MGSYATAYPFSCQPHLLRHHQLSFLGQCIVIRLCRKIKDAEELRRQQRRTTPRPMRRHDQPLLASREPAGVDVAEGTHHQHITLTVLVGWVSVRRRGPWDRCCIGHLSGIWPTELRWHLSSQSRYGTKRSKDVCTRGLHSRVRGMSLQLLKVVTIPFDVLLCPRTECFKCVDTCSYDISRSFSTWGATL